MTNLDTEELNLIIKELKSKNESGWIEVKENNLYFLKAEKIVFKLFVMFQ